MKRSGYFVCLTLCVFSYMAEAQTGTIVYGANYAYQLTAPANWMADHQAGKAEGIHTVFYPGGGSWKSSRAVMYTNTVPLAKNSSAQQSLKTVVAAEIAHFVNTSACMEVFTGDSISTHNGQNKALVKYYKEHNGSCQAVAYLPEPGMVVMITLRAKNEKEFQRNLPAFTALVQSYSLLTKPNHGTSNK